MAQYLWCVACGKPFELSEIPATCPQCGFVNGILPTHTYDLAILRNDPDIRIVVADARRAVLQPHALPEDPDHTPIEKLAVRVRTYNILKRAGIQYVQQLQQMRRAELMALRHFDETMLSELITHMKALGIEFMEQD